MKKFYFKYQLEEVTELKYKIYFEKFTEEDFEKYFILVNNEKVMAMITERAIELTEAKSDYNKLLEKNKFHENFGSFKVFESKDKAYIGLAKLEVENNDMKEAELGYMLLPEYWGKGYGSEIAKLMIEKAENEKLLKKITAIIDPENKASKILLNNGFTSEKLCKIDGLAGEILVLCQNTN